MKNLYQIQKLINLNTEITSPTHVKCIHDKKGNALYLKSPHSINSLAVLEFVPDSGVRGNHYHNTKREIIYIVDGMMKFYFWLPNKPEIEEIVVEGGDLITIEPKLGHAFAAMKKTFGLKIGIDPSNPHDTVSDERIR